MNVIYKITNTVNGKIYIGQTNNAKRRWKDHRNCTPRQAIDLAMRKYGKDNFTFEIIDECDSELEANIQESWFIFIYNSLSPIGYNIELGGKNASPTNEVKKKISESNKGKHEYLKTPEFKNKVRDRSVGNKYAFGVSKSDEHKKKLSEVNKGKRKGMTWKLIDGKRVWFLPSPLPPVNPYLDNIKEFIK